MVYFFQVGATFSFKNAKFGPFFANLSRSYALFGSPFTGLNSAVVPPKLTIMRYAYLVTFSLQSFPLEFSLAQAHFLSFLREESIK